MRRKEQIRESVRGRGATCGLLVCALGLSLTIVEGQAETPPARPATEWIAVSDDQTGFVSRPSGRPFVPWGMNYDHDESGRLLEDYWETEWSKVREDFGEMKALGANVTRIHLQLGRFMRGPNEPDPVALARLDRLVSLAEETGIYVDLTGLGCYRKSDVPPWLDALPEAKRWDVQARFWAAIAEQCAQRPAVFCYDLMNEPVVSGGPRKPGDWLGPPFAGKYHFVQFISLDPKGRPRPDVAIRWIRTLTAAIRKHDQRRLITVGLVPWSLDRPGLTSGFVPQRVGPELDFVSVHLYPEDGELDAAMTTLRGFAVGRPVVIEEMFPLRCSAETLGRFIVRSRSVASGWIGFYWGQTPAELTPPRDIKDALSLAWLELFQRRTELIGR